MFFMLISEIKKINQKYIILTMLTLDSKVNFLFFLLHQFLVVRIALIFLPTVLCAGFTRLRYNNVQYRLCFTKVSEIGGIFDKSAFILVTKLNVLNNFF